MFFIYFFAPRLQVIFTTSGKKIWNMNAGPSDDIKLSLQRFNNKESLKDDAEASKRERKKYIICFHTIL